MDRRVSIAIGAIALAVACGSNPTGPAPASASPSTHFGVVTALKISGPSTIAPGTSAQFTATAVFSDQSTQDYTNKVSWSAQFSGALTISSTGLATGQSNGEARVQASMAGFVASANVVVVPVGTFRLTGTVTESGLSVWGAAVTVIAGTGTGFATTTDQYGVYRLYGVAGDLQVQVTDKGYVPLTKSTHVAADAVLDFPEFSQGTTEPAFSGNFTLTIQASDICTNIPVQDRIRTYTAVVTQTGPAIHVSLSGATFFIHDGNYGNSFIGRFEPAYLFFALGSPYYYSLEGPDVVEVIAPDRVMSIDGFVETTFSPSGMRAALQGEVDEYQLVNGHIGNSIAICHNANHLFMLTPTTAPARSRTGR